MDIQSIKFSRRTLFQQLKPCCVKLSQLAIQNESSSDGKEILEATANLLAVLETRCQQTGDIFDEKLADYVFFPLSQILRKRQKYTDRLSELSIRCIKILLQYGWKKLIALELANQLLVLITYVAGGKPGQKVILASEELLIEALGALTALFHAIDHTPGGSAKLRESEVILAIGYCITVILEAILEGPTAQIQFEALSALNAVWHSVRDPEDLSKFLPGTISVLTKFLMPTTRIRRSRKVLIKALSVFSSIVTSTLSDINTAKVRKCYGNLQVRSNLNSDDGINTVEWLKLASQNLRLALSNIVKLHSHEAEEVRRALYNLCITLLDECHDTLSESSQILVETCMSLHGINAGNEIIDRKTNLLDLAYIHAELIELIKETIHNWIITLPKIMQMNDESAKISSIGNLSRAQSFFSDLSLKSVFLEGELLKSLRDSISVTIDSSASTDFLQEAGTNMNSQAILNLVTHNSGSILFQPIILNHENQKNIRDAFMMFMSSLSLRESQIKIADEMLQYAKCATGPALLSSYWLSFQLLRVNMKKIDIEEFLESSTISLSEKESLEQELYSFSISLLTKNDNESTDWRLQAIAIEVIADMALRMRHSFRSELVDTLYPVVQFLGSPLIQLREHAIICLNIFSRSCGYSNSRDLIIANMDYMVNSISLQLNTFDITPRGPKVLIMIIHLTGPSLIPYLDDIIDSIFAALENYHGYQKLVEVLFSVLAEIVSVGSRSDQFQVHNIESSHCKRRLLTPSIESIIESYILPQIKSEPEPIPYESFPRAPWNSTETCFDKALDDCNSNIEDCAELQEIKKLPTPKIYKILQSITRLSQHYLTSSSPILRSRLLGLIRTSTCVLHLDEDNFLPLINDIWPVVIKRIYDTEPFVSIAACDTVAELCRCTGDFLASRINAEWPDILRWAKATKLSLSKEKKGFGSRGIFTQMNQVWEVTLRLLISIMEYVRIEDEMFDDLMELLSDIFCERKEVKNAMEVINEDAVWLALYNSGYFIAPKTPLLNGYTFLTYEIDIPRN